MSDRNYFICNLIAQYKTAPEVQTLLKEVYGVDLSTTSIGIIKRDNLKFVEKRRAKYLSEIQDVPISQERIRLERDEELYNLALTIADKKDKINTALTCLKEAREETKKVEHNNNFIQFNQFNQLTDEELIEKKRRLEDKILNIKAEVIKDGER
jgi:DNA-binding helix-hairpin-helix protein with protein kinase domain